MKILLINYRYFITGGPERYMFNIKAELEKAGHRIIPFSIKNNKNVKSEYSQYFTSNIDSNNALFFDQYKPSLKTYFKSISRQVYSVEVEKDLSELIKKTKPDVCYLLHHINKLSPSVIRACKKNNVPIVHRLSDYYLMCPQAGFFRSGHFCDECKNNKFSVVKHQCIRNSFFASLLKYIAYKFHKLIKIYNDIDIFVCTNNFMKKKMIEFGFDSRKLVVIPTFFNKNSWSNKNILKKRPTKEMVRMICAGNFDESKGTYDLLNAIRQLRDENSGLNFRLTLVGGLQQKEINKVLEYVKENDLGNIIQVYPSIETKKLQKIYMNSDLSIIPSRWVENMPNVLLESLYFSLPVIVPKLGCFNEIVDEEVAFKYTPYSVESLRNVIKTVISNPKQISHKSIKCRKYLEKNFSQKNHVNTLLKVMTEVIKCSK